MNMSIQHMLIPIETTNIGEIQEWCANYQRLNKYPVDFSTRFAIAFYQIAQGIEWKSSEINQAESFCSSIIHLLILNEQIELMCESHFGYSDNDFWLMYKQLSHPVSYEEILLGFARTQQMVYYKKASERLERAKRRYDKDRISRVLAELIKNLLSRVPSGELILQGFKNASTIMCGKL